LKSSIFDTSNDVIARLCFFSDVIAFWYPRARHLSFMLS